MLRIVSFRTSLVASSLLVLSASLTACAGGPAPTAADIAPSVSGQVQKIPEYSTYTDIGIAIEDRQFGTFDSNKDAYCEQVIEGFGISDRDVTLRDAEDKLVGIAPLTFSAADTTLNGGSLVCVWDFRLAELKSDSNFFTVEVEGVTATQDVTRDDLFAGLTLTVPDETE